MPKHLNVKMTEKSFTLLEVILAIFVITVGITGALGLIQQTTYYGLLSSSRLTANYLAQEGIEIVRNIRDGNWLARRTNPDIAWDAGIPIGSWEADYKTRSLTRSYAGTPLNIDPANFYSYSAGNQTKFKRKITITKETNVLKISVQVEWQERGKNHQVTAQGHLYSWRR
jgi:Tfp pilus assembly protein PilV